MIEGFAELIEIQEDSLDPRKIDPRIWASKQWEQLDSKKTGRVLEPFLKFQIKRAIKTMPELYSTYLKKIELREFGDLNKLPLLVKDTGSHTVGFREKVHKNPYILLPNDISSVTIYKSGGTRGAATPTFITEWDHLIEGLTLTKCFQYMGINSKSTALNMYNPTHKGGHLINIAFRNLGARVISRRTTDSATDAISTIKNYGVTVLAGVQGPIKEGDLVRKGGGIDFLSLVEAGQDVLEGQLEMLFITGYTLLPEVIAWSEANEKKLATCLGSTEAIPQAVSTTSGKLCRYNNLHLINGPHYVELVKFESGELVPVRKGETGLLAYTTLAREGTIYIRYAPGDSAKLLGSGVNCDCGLKTPIISEIRRIDIPEDTIAAGCCVG